MIKRSKFSLSHYNLLTCNMGELVPCGLTEVLPGDTFQHATSALLRCSPLLSPVMHPTHVMIRHFFVPHRLVWEDFEKFITGGPDGMDASVFPTINFPQNGPELGTLADYLGVPTDNPQAAGTTVSALPFRGYSLIWNEWFRDQDLQTALTIDLTSGPDTTTNVALQNVCWEKDYFTSARPWTQKGPQITIPLGTTAPVELDSTTGVKQLIKIASSHALPGATDPLNAGVDSFLQDSVTGVDYVLDPNGTMFADLTAAQAADINDLREAFALQRYQEARARYGSRYTEYLAYLGVRASDARLQRPEYLGGGKQTIQFSEVIQTGVTTDGDDSEGVGNLKGHGIAALRSNKYRKFFEEHGYVFTFISVKPKTMYVQGLHRHWNRRTKEDFWQKELQHVGQQEILNKEIYTDLPTGTATNQIDGTFGYQDRYDEYRRTESRISGDFRTTLDFWHFARIFSAQPTLNADFVKAVPTKEPFAIPSEDVLWIMARHSLKARRMVAPSGTSFIS